MTALRFAGRILLSPVLLALKLLLLFSTFLAAVSMGLLSIVSSPGDHRGTGDVHGIHGKRCCADGAGLADQPHRPAAIGGKAAVLFERSVL